MELIIQEFGGSMVCFIFYAIAKFVIDSENKNRGNDNDIDEWVSFISKSSFKGELQSLINLENGSMIVNDLRSNNYHLLEQFKIGWIKS